MTAAGFVKFFRDRPSFTRPHAAGSDEVYDGVAAVEFNRPFEFFEGGHNFVCVIFTSAKPAVVCNYVDYAFKLT